jgi:hypothetical protein
MKKCKAILLFTIFSFISHMSFAQKADDIVKKHVDSIGGKDNWAKVKSMKTEMAMKANGAEIKVTLSQVDKKAMRQDILVMGMEGYSILTNKEGWTFMPFEGQTKPEPMTEDDVKKAQDGLSIQSDFVTYKELGKKLEYIGKDDVDGTECFKLKMTDKDGIESTYFIDPGNYYVIKETIKMTINGKEMESSTSYGNYKKTDIGIVCPYSIIGPWGETEVTSLTINPTFDEKIFKPSTPATK